MDMDAPKIVWVLGSGFSRSLGGPLLYDLLSELGHEESRARFPNLNVEPAYTIFQFHQKDFRSDRPKYWRHAEEFLDFVDTAASPSSHRHPIVKKLLELFKGIEESPLDPKRLLERCSQAIAAECLFTLGASPMNLEAWEPYIQWSMSRFDTDTILTFNYDLVLETLGELKDISALGRESVLIPEPNGQLRGVRGQGVANILKLHGSVDWTDRGGSIQTVADVSQSLESGFIPLIATPGPTKSIRTSGFFRHIWQEATERLKVADVVVFLGYRFPPSDSGARHALLRALRDNKKPHIRVHTVLGPRTAEDDTVRLTKLLEMTLEGAGRKKSGDSSPSYDIVTQPLYVEDFLSVLNRPELLGPLG